MRIDLSGHQFSFPQLCACCCARAEVSLVSSASQTVGKGRMANVHTRAWHIPYCRACRRHIQLGELLVILLLSLTGFISVWAAVIWLVTNQENMGLTIFELGLGSVVALSILVAVLLSRLRSKDCQGIGRAVSYLGWQGTRHSFSVRSWRFAYRFMSINERKLVNLSPHAVRMLQKSGLDQESAAQSPERYLHRHQR